MKTQYNYGWSQVNTEPLKLDLRMRVLDALLIIVGILLFVALLGYMQQRDLNDAVETHRAAAKKAETMLAQCLNGKALYDAKDKRAYFCGRAVEVPL